MQGCWAHQVLCSPGHSPGRAARRCRPASRGCRSRSHPRGCRPPRWHRRSSRCSSGPRSRRDRAGCSPGPATLREGKAVGSPFRPRTALYGASCPNPNLSGLEHTLHRAHSKIRLPMLGGCDGCEESWGWAAGLLPPSSHCFCLGLMRPPGQGTS